MKKIYALNISTICLGLIFLFSGISKGIDITSFANSLTRYGLKEFYFLAPLLSSFEMFLGFALLFLVNPKKLSFIALILLIGLTIIFLIGYFFLGIDDCQCFGSVIKITPLISFAKNSFMIGITFWIWTSYPENSAFLSWQKVRLNIAILFSVVSLGVATLEIKTTHNVNTIFTGKELAEIRLKEMAALPKVDQYIVFFFLPSCSHCQNAVPSVRYYKEKGLVKEIIGIYPSYVTNEEIKNFKQDFKIDFKIQPCNIKLLNRVINIYPTILRVNGNRIVESHVGNIGQF